MGTARRGGGVSLIRCMLKTNKKRNQESLGLVGGGHVLAPCPARFILVLGR